MALTPATQTSPISKQENLAESFEKAFQACHACLTHPEGYLRTDHEETRATADQCINNFLDSARQLEVFFLKKRLLLCRDKPENILKEEIENIEAEIERKNQVVTKHKERLATWQQKLADVGKPKPETTSTATTTSSTSSTTTPASAASTPPTTTTSQASNTSGPPSQRLVATPTPPPTNVPMATQPPTRGRGSRGGRGGYGRSPGRATPTTPNSQESNANPLAHLEHATSQVGR